MSKRIKDARQIITLVALFWLICFPVSNALAVEIAPRISDKEIIEGLASIRGDIKEIRSDIRRIEDGQKKIEDRIGKMEDRIDNLIFAVLGSIVVLIGIVIWDRRTALAPAIRRSKDLEEREERLEKALREYAVKEPRLAEILRNVGIV